MSTAVIVAPLAFHLESSARALVFHPSHQEPLDSWIEFAQGLDREPAAFVEGDGVGVGLRDEIRNLELLQNIANQPRQAKYLTGLSIDGARERIGISKAHSADGPQPSQGSPCAPYLACTGHGPGCPMGL